MDHANVSGLDTDRRREDRRREFNDDRRRFFGGANGEIVFVCECADPECRASVVLTPDAYDAVRAAPPHVLLHDRHRAPAPGA